jgi:phosphoglycolate phosphatase
LGTWPAACFRRTPGSRHHRGLEGLFNRDYGGNWADKTRPYDGIAGLLDELAARGRPMAILSNKPHAFTVEMVKHFLGAWRFSAVYGARDSHPRKPDPAAALEISAEMQLPPARVLYAGDTGTDMQTARNAGMFAVGCLGLPARAELEESGPGSWFPSRRNCWPTFEPGRFFLVIPY